MKTNEIYDSMCGIDDKFLTEFDNEAAHIKRKKAVIKRILVTAACFLLLSAAGIALAKNIPAVNISKPEETSESVGQAETEIGKAETQVTATEELTSEAVIPAATTEELTSETVIPAATTEELTSEAVIPAATTEIAQEKDGDTQSDLSDYSYDSDGNKYKIFNPSTDVFAPADEMTLENRFCSFTYNGISYYPAADGNLTENDYEPKILKSLKASAFEIHSANANDEVYGIEYRATIDIYKLKDTDTSEAVACVISFNGETKAYKYFATENLTPSYS